MFKPITKLTAHIMYGLLLDLVIRNPGKEYGVTDRFCVVFQKEVKELSMMRVELAAQLADAATQRQELKSSLTASQRGEATAREELQALTQQLQQVSLTLTALVATIDAQWEGMGNVGSARYKSALLPPCLTIRVLSYSNW